MGLQSPKQRKFHSLPPAHGKAECGKAFPYPPNTNGRADMDFKIF
jgi:hypothetical protein